MLKIERETKALVLPLIENQTNNLENLSIDISDKFSPRAEEGVFNESFSLKSYMSTKQVAVFEDCLKQLDSEIGEPLGFGQFAGVFQLHRKDKKVDAIKICSQFLHPNKRKSNCYSHERGDHLVQHNSATVKPKNIFYWHVDELTENPSENDPMAAIVMPLMQMDLESFIRVNGPFTTGDIFKKWLEVLFLMKKLFNDSVIHRDLKPQNILQDKDGKLYLSDCTLAKRYSHFKASLDSPVGSQGYIAPERGGFVADPEKSEMFSFGGIMHYFASAKHPPTEYFTELNLKCDPVLQKFIQKCRRMEPTDRPSIYEAIPFFINEMRTRGLLDLSVIQHIYEDRKITEFNRRGHFDLGKFSLPSLRINSLRDLKLRSESLKEKSAHKCERVFEKSISQYGKKFDHTQYQPIKQGKLPSIKKK